MMEPNRPDTGSPRCGGLQSAAEGRTYDGLVSFLVTLLFWQKFERRPFTGLLIVTLWLMIFQVYATRSGQFIARLYRTIPAFCTVLL
ncbi:hypothetical protein [Dictyobacter formicarum]|uniref:hypothetical protein n=1 Tax=Dictyobacter formicarum TaxID=2778368 RepID=UPI001915333A|nr:hypothetical protein [Dictyobacter formicarum]